MASTSTAQLKMETLSPPTSRASSRMPIPRKAVPCSEEHHLSTYTRLSAADQEIVLLSLGAVSLDERHTLIQQKSKIYPPRGLLEGLYKDIIRSRVMSHYQYYSVCILFNFILLLILCAIMTVLSSMASGKYMDNGKDTCMTTIEAVNTINAGLLALMHHSGLPHRYKSDWKEFDGVEIHVKELMESGLVK
jgi:hypothetical protein